MVRGGALHSYGDPAVARLAPGDKVVCIEDVDHPDREPDGNPDRGPAAAG